MSPVPPTSPFEWLLDQVLFEVIRHGWLSFRERFEVGIEGVAYGFMLGHNLMLLHGGWQSGPGRIIEPICFTVHHPRRRRRRKLAVACLAAFRT